MGEKVEKLNHEKALEYIESRNRERRNLGLSEIKTGLRKCLKCDTEFYSYDIKRHRFCSSCGQYVQKHGDTAVYEVGDMGKK